MSLDQHSIHMCLESRDLNGRGNLIHRRLPIDLASFLNIDARQMNRNLAYLTGLQEPVETPTASGTLKKADKSLVSPQDLEKTSYSISDSVSFIRNRSGAEWRALLPVGLLLFSVLTAVLTGIPSYRSSSAPAISINSKVMSAVPISTASSSLSSLIASLSSATTSTAVKTSTRTITVTHAPSAVSNSLSVLPSMEFGKTAHASAKPVNRSLVCSAEILGDREILIRIPSATKLSWLTKEALSVNITRGNITVDTERAYSSDEGVILLLPKNQAYGVLNISIVTTKRPKVNETFQVDFGTTMGQSWQTFVHKVSSLFAEEGNVIPDAHTYEQMRTAMDKMLENARSRSQSYVPQMEEARRAAVKQATFTGTHLTELAKSITLQATKRSAILSKEIIMLASEAESKVTKKLKLLGDLREPIDSGLLKARVQSKLLWLKLQGKHAEYKEYETRATKAVNCKKASKSKGEKSKTSCRDTKKASVRETRAARKSGRQARV